jgi:hypothetical protein
MVDGLWYMVDGNDKNNQSVIGKSTPKTIYHEP